MLEELSDEDLMTKAKDAEGGTIGGTRFPLAFAGIDVQIAHPDTSQEAAGIGGPAIRGGTPAGKLDDL